ncbi:MAG: DUF4358 domain-containing protein [Lachnospiraceae bacterium]|nr:DUF4358 domain-containing protein [Lachnospiraceae bacterium]
MRKRFLCMMLAGAMALSMTACGDKKNDDDKQPTPSAAAQPSEAPTQAPAAFEDFSVKEMMDAIVDRMSEDIPMMMQGSEMELTEIYKLDASKIEEYDIRIPMMNVTATELAVFKAASEADVPAVVEGINQRVAALKEQWRTYLEDQYELVEKNKVLVQGRYVFLIIGAEDLSAYAENVFMRKFDPSIQELVLVRKFHTMYKAVIKELSDESITVDYTEDGKTYTFECTFSEYFYAEGGIESFSVGDTVDFTLEEPVKEADNPMKGVVSYLAAPAGE